MALGRRASIAAVPATSLAAGAPCSALIASSADSPTASVSPRSGALGSRSSVDRRRCRRATSRAARRRPRPRARASRAPADRDDVDDPRARASPSARSRDPRRASRAACRARPASSFASTSVARIRASRRRRRCTPRRAELGARQRADAAARVGGDRDVRRGAGLGLGDRRRRRARSPTPVIATRRAAAARCAASSSARAPARRPAARAIRSSAKYGADMKRASGTALTSSLQTSPSCAPRLARALAARFVERAEELHLRVGSQYALHATIAVLDRLARRAAVGRRRVPAQQRRPVAARLAAVDARVCDRRVGVTFAAPRSAASQRARPVGRAAASAAARRRRRGGARRRLLRRCFASLPLHAPSSTASTPRSARSAAIDLEAVLLDEAVDVVAIDAGLGGGARDVAAGGARAASVR